jgi:serine protease Do
MESTFDCGMIKIDDEVLVDVDLPSVGLGWSSDLVANQPCISLGHPSGFNKKRGTVVRFGRIAEAISSNNGMIRSTCLMEPGDSGGPLFDRNRSRL